MTTQQYDHWGNPIYNLVLDLRTSADSAQEDLNYRHQLLRDAADAIETWRELAKGWMAIAGVLICPDDDDTERLEWARGEGFDDLIVRTNAVGPALR